MHRYNVEAVVLKSTNYKDTDKIFTLYTKEKGKISALAKGVRKISSRRAGSLDILNHAIIGISESETGFRYITEVQATNSLETIKADLNLATKGFYIAEILHKFTEEEGENRDVFDLLVNSLKLLNSQKIDADHIVTYFEVSLIKYLGYELSFNACINCNRKFSSEWGGAVINLGLGGIVCGDCSSSVNGFDVSLESVTFINKLLRGKFSNEIAASGGQSSLDFVHLHLKDLLDGKIKSFDLL